jgi:predicted DNA binding protein
MTVRTNRRVDLLDFNPYKLEYCRAREARLDGKTWQYYVEFMLYEKADETTADMLFQSGCLFQPPAIVRGRYELQTMLAPTSDNIRRLFRILKRHRRDYKTMALREVEPGPRMLFTVEESGLLTPKQLEAIRIAFRRGFYNYPRRIRISDLAKEAGSARSTFQEHLRLAEIRLLTHTFQTEDPSSDSRGSEEIARKPRPNPGRRRGVDTPKGPK